MVTITVISMGGETLLDSVQLAQSDRLDILAQRAAAAADPNVGEILEVPLMPTLCQYAEELCVGASVTVCDAFSRLHAAREALLRQLTAKDAYVLAKRSACNQARLRAALELMVRRESDVGSRVSRSGVSGGGKRKRGA